MFGGVYQRSYNPANSNQDKAHSTQYIVLPSILKLYTVLKLQASRKQSYAQPSKSNCNKLDNFITAIIVIAITTI
jgi:hypothetical protein